MEIDFRIRQRWIWGGVEFVSWPVSSPAAWRTWSDCESLPSYTYGEFHDGKNLRSNCHDWHQRGEPERPAARPECIPCLALAKNTATGALKYSRSSWLYAFFRLCRFWGCPPPPPPPPPGRCLPRRSFVIPASGGITCRPRCNLVCARVRLSRGNEVEHPESLARRRLLVAGAPRAMVGGGLGETRQALF